MDNIEGKLCPLCKNNFVTLKKQKVGAIYICAHTDLFIKQKDCIKVGSSIHSDKDNGRIFKISGLETPKRLKRV